MKVRPLLVDPPSFRMRWSNTVLGIHSGKFDGKGMISGISHQNFGLLDCECESSSDYSNLEASKQKLYILELKDTQLRIQQPALSSITVRSSSPVDDPKCTKVLEQLNFG